MSAHAIDLFMQYFDAFESALSSGAWDRVGDLLAEDAHYSVQGVPFACEIEGRAAILEAFQRSTSGFDATMDFRMLEILSIVRLSAGHIRVELISGYGRHDVGAVTAPVTIEVEVSEKQIRSLGDRYDPELTAPALTWLSTHAGDANPSYL
ncbi:MAG: hypothetical protein AAGL66_17810 [Pseudomonadota bacterium]